MAKITLLEPEEVAAIAIHGMFNGRRVIIPGRMTQFIFNISKFIPEGLVLVLIRNLFKGDKSI